MEGWRTISLGDLCRIELGGTPARKSPTLWDPDKKTGNVWLSIADLPKTLHTHVTDSKEYIADEAAKKAKLVREGTLLVSFKLTLGRLAYAGRDLYTNEAIAALTILDEQLITRTYLYWYLTFFDWHKAAEGDHKIKGKTLNKAKLKVLPILVPSLAKQEWIVAILDEAFGAIATATANAEKNLHNARELFQSVLNAACSGELTKERRVGNHSFGLLEAESDIGNLLEKIRSSERKRNRRMEETEGHDTISELIPKEWCLTSIDSIFNLIDYRGKNPPKSKSGKRLITAKNIKMGYIADTPITFISEETYKKFMVRGFPKQKDILFVTEGHTMGFVALNTREDEFALAQRTITLQPAVPFSTEFVFYFMMSSHFQKLVKLNATGAAAVGMKASKFRNLPLVYPSLLEQKVIVEKLNALSEETNRLAAIYQRKIESLADLKQSILQKAFAGELIADAKAADSTLLEAGL